MTLTTNKAIPGLVTTTSVAAPRLPSSEEHQPVLVVEVSLVKLPNKFTKLLLNSLQADLAQVLLIVSCEIVGEKDSWIIESFHFSQAALRFTFHVAAAATH